MTPQRRNLLVSGFVAATALGAGALIAPAVLRQDPKPNALRSASFVDLRGKSRSLSEWEGKVLVANFWATWCAPCLEEIPLLIATRRSRAGQGIEVVGIAVDQVAKVAEFADKMKIDYPILLADARGLELIRDLGNQSVGLPFTVFLDRSGHIVRTKLGLLRQADLDSVLGPFPAR
jgi:thiol-disulfide isomerase/thioredoxin